MRDADYFVKQCSRLCILHGLSEVRAARDCGEVRDAGEVKEFRIYSKFSLDDDDETQSRLLADWYDEPSTSRSSPDYENNSYGQQLARPSPPASTMTSSSVMTTTRRTTTVTAARFAPYADASRRTPAPAKRAPVFRPEGFGTPAIGENVNEYRARRDKVRIDRGTIVEGGQRDDWG